MSLYDDLFTFFNEQLPEVGSRIYPLHLTPDPVLPCVVIRRAGSNHDTAISGKVGTAYYTFDFSIHALDLSDLEAIGEKIKDMLHGQRDIQVGTRKVIAATCEDGGDDDSFYLEKEAVWIFVRTATYTMKMRD